jgi:hypothetical protein
MKNFHDHYPEPLRQPGNATKLAWLVVDLDKQNVSFLLLIL